MESMTATRNEPIAASPTTVLTLTLRGMTCGACAARIERRLNRIEGVSARVNYATERASVLILPHVQPERLLEEVASIGYSAEMVPDGPPSATADSADDLIRSLRRRLFVSAVLLMPLGDASLLFWLVAGIRFPGWQWFLLLLAAPVVGWAAWPFYAGALRAARHGATTMDTLVSIGILSSTIWSVYAMFWRDTGHSSRSLWWTLAHGSSGGIYLEVGAGVTTFLLAGRYFEARARRRAGQALRSLAQLGAKDVAIVQLDGSEQRLPISALAVGDRFVVRPGEAVATDGVVESGESALDRSAMTGESIPVDVHSGDFVTGGTVSLSGRLLVRATKVGADTQLAHMMQLVERAQNEKAAAQRLADRISGIFVPIVLVVAAATLAGWLLSSHDVGRAVSVALSVLIIACPCALGLATPAALVVASGEGAKQGVFFKGYRALERSRHIDTVVFDKTGTLTEGKMAVTEVWCAPGITEEILLSWAGAVEGPSQHPIARAISAVATQRVGGVSEARDFVSLTGQGVQAVVDGHLITVGRPDLFADGLVGGQLSDRCAQLRASAQTVILVGCDGTVVGVVGVADTLRPTAAAAVAELQALGLRCVLVSGDNDVAATAIGVSVGINEVVGGALPGDKVSVIDRLKAEGRTVAVVGDGVNDGPALAAADLGIAVGWGTDVAINAADLVILRDDLRVVANAVALARRTLRTIRGNLVWAFGYNVVAIPLAAAGFLDPLIAGAAMALSSAFVVYNSAAIRKHTSPTSSPVLLEDSEVHAHLGFVDSSEPAHVG
jgi:P-type Cu+ transporter